MSGLIVPGGKKPDRRVLDQMDQSLRIVVGDNALVFVIGGSEIELAQNTAWHIVSEPMLVRLQTLLVMADEELARLKKRPAKKKSKTN